MLMAVMGIFKNGVVELAEPMSGHDGQVVIVTFLESNGTSVPSESGAAVPEESEEDGLLNLLQQCRVHTGIGDLAHNHDHYLYGRPKRNP